MKSSGAAATTMTETFGGLKLWTNYSFTMCAYTVKGNGTWSAPITVATDEEGKNFTGKDNGCNKALL